MTDTPEDDKTWHIKVREDGSAKGDGEPMEASDPGLSGSHMPGEPLALDSTSEDPVVISIEGSGPDGEDPTPIVIPPIEETVERSKYVELLREHRRIEDELKKLQAALYGEKVKAQTAEDRSNEFKQQIARSQAEFQNFRRRVDKEKEEATRYAYHELLADLLPVLDNFDRGIVQPPRPETIDDFYKGMSLIHKQLQDLLHRYEMRPLDTHGVPFDPNFHEAVTRVPSPSVPADHVVQDLQKGYLYKDRLVRPALVAVSGGQGEANEADSDEPEPESEPEGGTAPPAEQEDPA